MDADLPLSDKNGDQFGVNSLLDKALSFDLFWDDDFDVLRHFAKQARFLQCNKSMRDTKIDCVGSPHLSSLVQSLKVSSLILMPSLSKIFALAKAGPNPEYIPLGRIGHYLFEITEKELSHG